MVPLEKVTFLHSPQTRSWPAVATIKATFSSNRLNISPTISHWPTKNAFDVDVNANIWVVAQFEDKWFAATFEWLRPDNWSKPIKTVAGDHIKDPAIPWVWRPQRGDNVGFFVSGLARAGMSSIKERSHVAWTRWLLTGNEDWVSPFPSHLNLQKIPEILIPLPKNIHIQQMYLGGVQW